tara:strand:- start:214 stop:1494 length:1281 start_codon:yes stop_codon:yes gene_type:complete
MKTKSHVSKPCYKKGVDNARFSKSCEIKRECFSNKGFKYLRPCDGFKGCLEVETELIEENLLRYETREDLTLEFFSDSLIRNDSSHNYEILDGDDDLDFEYDPLSYQSYLDAESSSVKYEVKELDDKSLKKGKKKKRAPKKSFLDNFNNHLPSCLWYARPAISSFFESPPEDLLESYFLKAFGNKLFDLPLEQGDDIGAKRLKMALEKDDLLSAANCRLKRIDKPKDLRRFWPRYTPKRFDKYKELIDEMVKKTMPYKMLNFDLYWKSLTGAQTEAMRLEHFYKEDEKPTQEENASRLGIKVSSYKDRLEGATKKLEKFFGMKRASRRSKKEKKDENPPLPLYEIIDGKRVQIEFPTIKDRPLSGRQLQVIRDKIYKGSYIRNMDTSIDEIDGQEEQIGALEGPYEQIFDMHRGEDNGIGLDADLF